MKEREKNDKKQAVLSKADEPVKSTGERIRTLRRKNGFTLEDFGGIIGYSPSYLSKIECDERRPSAECLMLIARLLGTTIDFLLGDADHETAEEEVNALIEDDAKKSLALVNESRPFWRFLGVGVRYEASEEPFDKETGEAIPVDLWEEGAPPSGVDVGRRVAERHLAVHVSGKFYEIDPECWSSVVEIAKSAALGALKATCAVFDRTAKNMQ